jgi:hypothetical protein
VNVCTFTFCDDARHGFAEARRFLAAHLRA